MVPVFESGMAGALAEGPALHKHAASCINIHNPYVKAQPFFVELRVAEEMLEFRRIVSYGTHFYNF
jgi:hypothetical protein